MTSMARLAETTVDARHRDGRTSPAHIVLTRNADKPPRARHPTPDDLYEVVVDAEPFGVVTARSGVLWHALNDARTQLEKQGWLLGIIAAHPDYYPTHWPRNPEADMLADYRRQVAPTLGIFEKIDPADAATVDDQEKRYQEWRESGQAVRS
jgi:hypothetical protein